MYRINDSLDVRLCPLYYIISTSGLVGICIVLYFLIVIDNNWTYCDDVRFTCFYEGIINCRPSEITMMWKVYDSHNTTFNVTQTINPVECLFECCRAHYQINKPYDCKLDENHKMIAANCTLDMLRKKNKYEDEMNEYIIYWLMAFVPTCVCMCLCICVCTICYVGIDQEKNENDVPLCTLENKDDT